MCDMLCCGKTDCGHQSASKELTMDVVVEGNIDGSPITDNTVRVELGGGKARMFLNGIDITGMALPGFSLTAGPDDTSATLTVSFPVRMR